MRIATGALGLSLILGAAPNGVLYAQATARVHIGHVNESFRGTPDEQGLLPTAIAEAKIAQQHAALAAKTPDNLDAMKRHTDHVLHTVDPTVVESGPGLGYGVKRAAAGVAQHIELAAQTSVASANVKTHATHVAASAKTVAARADEILALGQRIQAATSASEAAPLVTELHALTEQILAGFDANGDGRVGWQEGEGGLQQAQQHMELMMKGEGR